METPPPATLATTRPGGRLDSIDLLRGVIMVVMALDHVRDFFSDRLFMNPVDLATTTPGIFLTRWITHYCAPTFVFLAGVGAFLSGVRGKSKLDLSIFLLTRGLWLVFLDLTVIRASWMFNFDPYDHGVGVIWVIGWAMVVLSLLVFLPTWLVTWFGVLMIVSHNLLDVYGVTAETLHVPEWLWVMLHKPGGAPIWGNIKFGTGYCLIPWVGVMAAGYGFGQLFLLDAKTRRTTLATMGCGLIAGFAALRYSNYYGDPHPWEPQSTKLFSIFSILNCTKYPPSLLYLMMTLGPSILFLAIFDGVASPLAKPFITFGRVPLFFYLLHIPLIHGGIVALDYLRYGWSPQWLDGPWAVQQDKVPASYGVSLPMVYVLWVLCVALLYPLCHWFAGVKQRHRDWRWLSYL